MSRDTTVAKMWPIGETLFRKRIIWRILIIDGPVSYDTDPSAKFIGTREEAIERAQDMIDRYAPPPRPDKSVTVRPRGWLPTVGPKGPGGASR